MAHCRLQGTGAAVSRLSPASLRSTLSFFCGFVGVDVEGGDWRSPVPVHTAFLLLSPSRPCSADPPAEVRGLCVCSLADATCTPTSSGQGPASAYCGWVCRPLLFISLGARTLPPALCRAERLWGHASSLSKMVMPSDAPQQCTRTSLFPQILGGPSCALPSLAARGRARRLRGSQCLSAVTRGLGSPGGVACWRRPHAAGSALLNRVL